MAIERQRIVGALLASAATAATVFLVTEAALGEVTLDPQILGAWIFAFIVALAHAIILGLPAYSFLKKRNLTEWWVSIPGGFIVGALPVVIFLFPWPRAKGERWTVDGVDLLVDGVTTHAGWVSYMEMVAAAGSLGIAGGLAAWIVWRVMAPQKAG